MKILVDRKGLLEVKKVWYDEYGLNCALTAGEIMCFPKALPSIVKDIKQNACTDLTQYEFKTRRV